MNSARDLNLYSHLAKEDYFQLQAAKTTIYKALKPSCWS